MVMGKEALKMVLFTDFWCNLRRREIHQRGDAKTLPFCFSSLCYPKNTAFYLSHTMTSRSYCWAYCSRFFGPFHGPYPGTRRGTARNDVRSKACTQISDRCSAKNAKNVP